MTYTLTLCLGLFLGKCGSVHQFDFPDQQVCEQHAEQVKGKVSRAVCRPLLRRTVV